MNFYRTPDGQLINLDLVRSIKLTGYERDKPERTGKYFTQVKFIFDAEHSIGERYECTAWEVAEQLPPLGALIPASPGFFAVRIWFEETEPDFTSPAVQREPIIGWRSHRGGGLRPVCIDEWDARWATECDYDDQHFGGILHPDGRVQVLEGDTYQSVDEWVASCRKRAIEAKEGADKRAEEVVA